jgi:hypothetical protein
MAIENRDDQAIIQDLLKIGTEEKILFLSKLILVDPTTHNSHLLYVAARHGNVEVIKKLLEHPYIDIHTDNPMVFL